MSELMYAEHRRVNPTVREVRQPVPGGSVTVVWRNGEDDIGDLDLLIDTFEGLVERLLELRAKAPRLMPDCPTVSKAPGEICPGDRFWANGAWHVASSDAKGRAALFDVWGDTPILTGGAVIYVDSNDEVLVAVPECDGSVMDDEAAMADIRSSAMEET